MRLMLNADVPDVVAIVPLQASRPGSHYDVVTGDGDHLLRVLDWRQVRPEPTAGMFAASSAVAAVSPGLQVATPSGEVIGKLVPRGSPKDFGLQITDTTNAVIASLSGKRNWARANFSVESAFGSMFHVRSFGLHALQSGFVVDDGDGHEVAHARAGAALSLPGAPSAAAGGMAVTFDPESYRDRDLILLALIGIDLSRS